MSEIPFVMIGRVADKAVLAEWSHESIAETLDSTRSIFKKVLKKAESVGPGERTRLEHEEQSVVILRNYPNGDIMYEALTQSKHYSERLIYAMMNEILLYTEEHFGDRLLTCEPDELSSELSEFIEGLAIKYSDPTQVDKLAATNAKCDQVKKVMENNIQKMLANTETIVEVEEDAEKMDKEAKVFKKTASKLERHYFWKNVKFWLVIGAIIVIVLLIVFRDFFFSCCSSKK